jgi:hypothetical protein
VPGAFVVTLVTCGYRPPAGVAHVSDRVRPDAVSVIVTGSPAALSVNVWVSPVGLVTG